MRKKQIETTRFSPLLSAFSHSRDTLADPQKTAAPQAELDRSRRRDAPARQGRVRQADVRAGKVEGPPRRHGRGDRRQGRRLHGYRAEGDPRREAARRARRGLQLGRWKREGGRGGREKEKEKKGLKRIDRRLERGRRKTHKFSSPLILIANALQQSKKHIKRTEDNPGGTISIEVRIGRAGKSAECSKRKLID